MRAWSQEASRGDLDELALSRRTQCLALEIALDDALDTLDVVEIEVDGPAAGSVEPLASVLGNEAQELLRLTKPGPGEVACEELLHEGPQVRPMPARLRDHAIGVTHCVGSELPGVVRVVGGSTPRGDSRMRLHELALHVEPDQLRVATNRDDPAHVAGGR